VSSQVDIVVPVFNESHGIEAIIGEVLRILDRDNLRGRVRIILVDDGSIDDTFAAIQRLLGHDDRIAALRLTRNFGKEAAIEAGLTYSSGEAVVVMDSDLQHPPELLRTFVAEWENGALVVEAVKRERGEESWSSRFLARFFYRLFGLLSELQIDNHTDFKLLDRQIVNLYLRLPERRKFFRGLVPWMGHAAVRVPFDVPARAAGRSTWPRLRLLRYAWDNICSFSGVPLRTVGVMGAVAIVCSLVMLAIAMSHYLRGTAAAGFTTVIFLVVFLSGIQLTAVGILGSFVGRVYDELKHRPSFLVSDSRKLGDVASSGIRKTKA